jgi:hypothetical protein
MVMKQQQQIRSTFITLHVNDEWGRYTFLLRWEKATGAGFYEVWGG